jgi:hypothetical protein
MCSRSNQSTRLKRLTRGYFLAVVLLQTSSIILSAQAQKPQLQQQCDAGNKTSCKALADQACSGVSDNKLKCGRTAQCYMDLTILLNQTASLIAGTSQHCEEQTDDAITPTHYEGIVVGWFSATSSTIDTLHNGSRLIGLAFPPGKSFPLGVKTYDVPEIPYDADKDTYLYVCQAYVQNNNTHDIAWVPGKLLNNNCNVVFEGGAVVDNTFQMASVVSDMKGYWWPIPAGSDFSKYLQSSAAPDGSRLTVCSAKISTDTKFFQDPFNTGVHWHGHHLGYLNSNDDCVVEWGGDAINSAIDVRIYYVGPQSFPKPPQLPDWYTNNLRTLGQCTLTADDGSSKCRVLSQSLCTQANGRFDANGVCGFK